MGRAAAGAATLQDVPAAATPREAPPRRSRLARVGIALVALAALAVLTAWFSVVSVHAFAPDSDGATPVLQGQAMASGNVILHGWLLPLDSFWSIEAPLYAVATAMAGVRRQLLVLVPAFTAAMVVLAAALLARQGRHKGAAAAGVVTVVALLVFPTHALASFYLRGAYHIGTVLLALLAFLAMRRNRFGPALAVGTLLLAAGMLGDSLMVAYGIVPVLFGGLFAMGRRRSWRAGAPAAVGSLAAAALAEAARGLLSALGGFTVDPSHPVAHGPQLLQNAKDVVSFGLALAGARNGAFQSGGVPGPLQAARIVGAVLLAAGIVAALARLVAGLREGQVGERAGRVGGSTWHRSEPEAAFLDDVLVTACVGAAATFCVLTPSFDPQSARYLVPSVIFASVLAGRTVARFVAATSAPGLRSLLVGVGSAATACYAAGVGYNVSAAPPPSGIAALASYLEAHHLTRGVGAYWDASITTVVSDGQVAVRPVVLGPTGTIVRYPHQSASTWYKGVAFQFLVFDDANPWGGVDLATAAATWGRPARVDHVGSLEVVVWPHPLRVGSL